MGEPLKKYHMGRLRPIMWGYGQRLPMGERGGPIQPAPYVGLGNYEGNVQTIDPRADVLWSNLYRIGAAGALSRVAPFGPSAFGDNNTGAGSVLPLAVILIGLVGVAWLAGR